ncbi:MAG: adenylate/guanylate cyclase domain-containing protein [Deferrisomatales bacterium]
MGRKAGIGDADGRILDSLGWGVLVVGRWSRTILRYNRRMAEITGYPAAAALGRHVAEFFAYLRGLDLEALDDEIQRTGGFEARSLRLERHGGEVVYRHLRGDVLDGGTGEEEAVVVSVQDVTEREHMRLCMARYLTREVAELVLSIRPGETLAGRELNVAVLVADMRDFTDAAEGLTPEELFETLNAYLAPMAEAVVAHRGMIDKFTGDGFMAVFGAPSVTGGEAGRALRAALDLVRVVDGLSEARGLQGLPQVGVGYGVHWGTAQAGNLGSDVRMEYTVVGDTVNLAHRVQALAAAGEILATWAAVEAGGPGFRWGDSRWVRLRGRKAPVKIQPLLAD